MQPQRVSKPATWEDNTGSEKVPKPLMTPSNIADSHFLSPAAHSQLLKHTHGWYFLLQAEEDKQKELPVLHFNLEAACTELML